MSNFVKIRAVGPEFFLADGQTDEHYKAGSRFSRFCEKRPKLFVRRKTKKSTASGLTFLASFLTAESFKTEWTNYCDTWNHYRLLINTLYQSSRNSLTLNDAMKMF